MLIKFSVRGNLRFLSHAETVKVFQRACVRAGINVRYSQGFNPRPKLSLPLPRSVGVETEDDLLCLQCSRLDTRCSIPDAQSDLCTSVKTRLSEQLPDGCELLSVSVAQAKASFQPCLATYVLTVRGEYLNEHLKDTIKRLLASESLNLQRRIDARGNTRNVDVRGFLKSIKLDDRAIVVECGVSLAGTIRVEELLKILELDYTMLAAPIRRTSVQWQSN